MQQKESKTNVHFRVSLLKSISRIAGGLVLILSSFSLVDKIVIFGIVFIVSEVLGIVEEIF